MMYKSFYQLALIGLTVFLMGLLMITGYYFAKAAFETTLSPPAVVSEAAGMVDENLYYIDDANAEIEANKGLIDEILNYI